MYRKTKSYDILIYFGLHGQLSDLRVLFSSLIQAKLKKELELKIIHKTLFILNH